MKRAIGAAPHETRPAKFDDGLMNLRKTRLTLTVEQSTAKRGTAGNKLPLTPPRYGRTSELLPSKGTRGIQVERASFRQNSN
jgi:hypothetical protein